MKTFIQVKVDEDKNVLAGDCSSWEEFNRQADENGLEISWDYGTARDGWWVSANLPA